MLPGSTTNSKGGPQAPGDETSAASSAASEAPAAVGVVAQASSADIDALERAAMRVRPSWENLEPVAVPQAQPLTATLLGTAPVAPVEMTPERPSQRPEPQVDPAASIIVNEPGVIVLDAPPPDLDMSKPEPVSVEPAIPQVQRGADMLSGATHQDTARHEALSALDDDDIAPPIASRRPWLWAVGGAALGLAVLVLTVGRSEPTSARLATPKAAAAPASPLPAPLEPPAAEEQLAPPVEAAAPEPALPSAVEPALAAHEPPAESARDASESKTTRKARKARVAAQRVQEPASRIAKAPAAKAAPAAAPAAQPASKKKGKGAGFVSANPYQ